MPTDAQVLEADVSALVTVNSPAQILEADVSALVQVQGGAQILEADVSALVYLFPCSSQRCQLWTITRKDGVVFRFTTRDVDVQQGELIYQACGSVQDSASESSSELGSVGVIEGVGIFDSDAITEADLHAGKFDDAYIEVWVDRWDANPDPGVPFRAAAGWTGKVTRGEANWTAEVLGPGARLQQAALVSFYTPGCRWLEFGDGVQCPVDVESLKLAGQAVTGSVARTTVKFTHADPADFRIWNGGRLRWLTGVNAGQVCQVNTVDFAAGVIGLWDLAPYRPANGDTFDLLPGCPRTATACVGYSVFENFGGFRDVPGPDALQSNADSLFTGANG